MLTAMTNRSVKQDLPNGWVAEMTWADDDYIGGPTQLVVKPADPAKPPAGGLSSTVLRDVRFKSVIDDYRAATAPESDSEGSLKRLVESRSEGVSDYYLALLSQEYVAAHRRGQQKINDYLAEILGKSIETTKQHLWKATRVGLLERTSARAGGRLTEKAINLLNRKV